MRRQILVAAANSVREFFVSRKESILNSIRTKAKFDDSIDAEMKKAYGEWKSTFTA